ncbi:MAG: hypothetical protein JHC98_09990 [Thermoleophilaceae bacterium]|nr:hypothetical protein [Thermoleophilaceae bacterium]
MYRQADEPHDSSEHVELPQGSRKFAPVPLGIFSGLIGLATEFFGLFLLAWGMAPTSIGCGVGRAASMTGAQLVIALGIFGAFAAVGIGIMREAHESQLRRRSYVLTFAAVYVLGSIPLIATAALFGSCFDF